MRVLRRFHRQPVALFARTKRVLGELALRDIGDHADAPARAALGVAHHLGARVDPARLARARNDPALELVEIPCRVFPVRPAQLGEDATAVVRVERDLVEEIDTA